MTMDVLKLKKIESRRATQIRNEQVCLHTQVPTNRTYVCVGNVILPVNR